MPTRRGTTGVALASSGLEAVVDLRGKEDLFGNILRVTSQAIADDLCSAAQLVMGESDEGAPFVVVRGLAETLITDAQYSTQRFAVKPERVGYRCRPAVKLNFLSPKQHRNMSIASKRRTARTSLRNVANSGSI